MVFWSFRLMAGLGMLMLLLGVLALAASRRPAIPLTAVSAFALWMGPSGLIAILAGW